MSATLQTQALIDYFEEFSPAQVTVQGRTFPVQEFFLEDVLRMTGFVDASTYEDGGLVANKEIELELAKLAAKDQEDMLLTCSICGQKDFVDAIELGTHMALCDIGGEEEEEEEAFIYGGDQNDLKTMIGTPTFASYTAFEDHDVNGSADLGKFEEYDVNGTAEIVTYGDFSVSKPKAKVPAKTDIDEAVGDTNMQKWDGKSTYQITNPERNGPSLAEDVLLDRYQGMHNDDAIDYFLLTEVLHYIVKSSYGDGAILVFLPGWQEISEVTLMLETTAPFYNRSKYMILPLHSGIPSKEQRRVLQRPPSGVRKIVLSTNIAETSLTIDDISFVIDTGRAKLKDYDPHLKTSTLQATWISKASAKQRKGRAGRTKAGVCFHLFSRRRHDFMCEFVESELLRTPLVGNMTLFVDVGRNFV